MNQSELDRELDRLERELERRKAIAEAREIHTEEWAQWLMSMAPWAVSNKRTGEIHFSEYHEDFWSWCVESVT